jgi:hypothetical protein
MKLADFSSLQWWLSVGVATLLFSLCSDIFKRGVYRLLARVSDKWQDRNARSVARFDRAVKMLSASPRFYAIWERAEMRSRSNAVMTFLIGLFGLGMFVICSLSASKCGAAPVDIWDFHHIKDNSLSIAFLAGAIVMFGVANSECRKILRKARELNGADRLIREEEFARLSQGSSD